MRANFLVVFCLRPGLRIQSCNGPLTLPARPIQLPLLLLHNLRLGLHMENSSLAVVDIVVREIQTFFGREKLQVHRLAASRFCYQDVFWLTWKSGEEEILRASRNRRGRFLLRQCTMFFFLSHGRSSLASPSMLRRKLWKEIGER